MRSKTNKERIQSNSYWIALASTLLLCTNLQAETAPEQTGRQIEEVIVTAERQEASIQDTSISITALTGEFLGDFGIRNQEDLQNFVPATTIQPYDATVRGVGRNFRALGGDPGVATYMNGVYSEDLLTATAATFWDVERVEILRGPQGTLYGRNAVGGAINILYEQPTDEFEAAVMGILGNFGTQEYYGMVSGPLIEDQLSGRLNFSFRDRDGVIEDIGGHDDLDGLGTFNAAVQFKWTPTDTIEVNARHNWMDIDRIFGGANGGGLVVLNEEGNPKRNTHALVPGYRFIDTANTDIANYDQNDWYDASQPTYKFIHPTTGEVGYAQNNRAGVDYADFDGFQNAAASLDGFNNTSAASAAAYNKCVFPDDIKGADVCAATNGLNQELFNQQGTQISVAWDYSESLQLKYIFGYNRLSYQRITDDDNTASMYHDRQFYVNHEADYTSHEIQAFYDFSDTVSVTSGIFFYDATIDQRGDFYSSVGESRMINAYVDNSSLSAAGATALGSAALEGLSASTIAFGGRPMATLFSAKESCQVASPADSCKRNAAVADPGLNNLYTSPWYGDNGSDQRLNVINGPDTIASDLLYATKTERDAFAAYTQGVWDINEDFTLTVGLRYASDEVTAEENLFRYSEAAGNTLLAVFGGLAAYNRVNGGLVDDGNGNLTVPTELATNGGIPFALSVYRPFDREDTKVTGRINLDWDISDEIMFYLSATSGYRSGGYNLVFFSLTPTYDPEELIAYELGYKTQFMDNTLQINGSFYFYDYDNIHTTATEVSTLGGTTTSVLAAPGAKVTGAEVDVLWLATDNLTLGGNLSLTPSEYTKDLLVKDPTNVGAPGSLYADQSSQIKNIKGNQLLQVPDSKFTTWGSYKIPLEGGNSLAFHGVYNWVDEVYYSPFQSEAEKADAYGRLDLRTTWTSAKEDIIVSAFVNNVMDDVGVLQVLRQGEGEFFRHNAGTTTPRMYGVEFTYKTGAF